MKILRPQKGIGWGGRPQRNKQVFQWCLTETAIHRDHAPFLRSSTINGNLKKQYDKILLPPFTRRQAMGSTENLIRFNGGNRQGLGQTSGKQFPRLLFVTRQQDFIYVNPASNRPRFWLKYNPSLIKPDHPLLFGLFRVILNVLQTNGIKILSWIFLLSLIRLEPIHGLFNRLFP